MLKIRGKLVRKKKSGQTGINTELNLLMIPVCPRLAAFHWSLSDSKFLLVFKTLPNILSRLNNAAAWLVSILPLYSDSSNRLSNLLETVPNVTLISTAFSALWSNVIIIIIIYSLRVFHISVS